MRLTAHQAVPCWNRRFSAITPLSAPHRLAQERAVLEAEARARTRAKHTTLLSTPVP